MSRIPTRFDLEDVDALIALADGDEPVGEGIGWEHSDHAEALRAKLREHRSALADAMERYEGSGS